MFERKIKNEYLKLAQIVYGGEFYLQLKNYKLKEIETSKFQKVTDSLLSKQDNNNFYAYKNDETGFVGNVFDNGKNLVIAFRGTERIGLGENESDLGALMKDVMTDVNLMTGNFDKHFQDAWDFYKEVKKQNPKRKIVIVGQSLGGALAQIVGAKEYTINRNKVETYTFNAPGCSHLLDIYDCNLNFDYSFITNYSVMNDWCGMFGEHIGKRYLIKSIEIPESKTDSTIEFINNVLLVTHEGIFDYSEEKNGKVITKPNTFNQKEGLSLWYYDKNNPLKEYPNLSSYIKENIPNIPQIDFSKNEFIQKTQQFFTENIPEDVQNSPIGIAIKKATDNFMSSSSEQMTKMAEYINNSTYSVALKVLDSLIAELSLDSLENAKKLLEKIK